MTQPGSQPDGPDPFSRRDLLRTSLLKEMPRVYASVVRMDPTPYATYYQEFIGPGALFDEDGATKITDVIDAAVPTLMIVEAAEPALWTKPEDLPYDDGKPLPKLGRQFEDGV